jgi:hypothetical protein
MLPVLRCFIRTTSDPVGIGRCKNLGTGTESLLRYHAIERSRHRWVREHMSFENRRLLHKYTNSKKTSCIFDATLPRLLEMKHTIYFCCLTLLLGATAISPSYGQDSGTARTDPNSSLQSEAQSGPRKRHASPDAIKKRQLSVLKKEAALTADQESKVTPIISKYVDEVVALKNDTSQVGAAKREKRKTLHTQYLNDIDAVLTPDQQKSWAAANAARLERLRSARGAAKPSASAGENE